MVNQELPYPSTPTVLTEVDVGDIAELYVRCADYFLLQDGELATAADAAGLFQDVPPEKEHADQTILGWKGSDGLYAMAAILRDYPSPGTWYLGFLIVDASLRGQGLGHSLYQIIEHWVRERGAKEIRLSVLEANFAGERFWRSLGFSEVRRLGPNAFKTRTHRRVEFNRVLDGSITEVPSD